MKIKLALKQLDYFSDEAYKKLRTNIQLCGGNKKVIAFTSSIPNEGKSSVSLNLALSMAEAGKGTLFIDADLRKSVLKARVRVKDKVDGLTNYLTEQAEIKEIIYSTEFPELDIIFSGPVPPNPAELLGGERFQELVHQVRKEYDYVIIDAPPIGSVIDAAIIAPVCDGIIICGNLTVVKNICSYQKNPSEIICISKRRVVSALRGAF